MSNNNMKEEEKSSEKQLHEFFAGIDYPAKKEDVIAAARKNGAPDDVIAECENLTSDEFSSMEEIIEEYGKSEMEDPDVYE